jgi:vacuolar protein sorting-associated protein 51
MSESDISSDSDEEFLTVVDDKKGSLDREALVRKKLLESFYGKSAVAAAAPDILEDDDDDDDDDIKRSASNISSASRAVGGATHAVEDLDSPSFDAASYTKRLVVGASVHELLEKEEQLALQVRTLDSTMQTLVYENYTRFIDATDAIRSIGVNVQANEKGLARLVTGMQAIDERSRAVEDSLGSLRDQVAEKIRVKRLLTRLDALLKLPRTLREQIAAGNYRTATKSYLQAASILGKHSEGFESLKNIETECTSILSEMKVDLYQKLSHWSGRTTTTFDANDDTDAVPDPPKSMKAIFECVGTVMILLQSGESISDAADSEITVEDLLSMASNAALRLLDRALDAHLIEIQERRYGSSSFDSSVLDVKLNTGAVPGMELEGKNPVGASLVAKDVLKALLDGATLFATTFSAGESAKTDLMEFVSEAFSSFLVHTKSVLLDENSQLGKDEIVGQDEATDEAESSGYLEISGALSLLVQSVRELASGLAIPEVGVSVDYASSLVDRATDLTKSMVSRRVDQQFRALRLSVVQDCLIPFATQAAAAKASSPDRDILSSIRQNVSSTLSNCLQLVDDTIRSILARDQGPSAYVPDLKITVELSTKRFAFWLANAFEVLAGGESSDWNRIVDASSDFLEERDEGVRSLDGVSLSTTLSIVDDDLGDLPGRDETLLEKLDSAIATLTTADDEGNGSSVHTDFILAIAEMCRMARASVSVNLEQSIATHLGGGGKRKSRGIFPSGDDGPVQRHGERHDVGKRFQLAESRVLILYASYRGAEAANLLCRNLEHLSEMRDGTVLKRPTDLTVQALAIAKLTSIEFFSVYGESKRAGPVTKVDDRLLGVRPALASRKTGLQLDVERMFKEKVQIYPQPSDPLEISRNATIFLLFKIAFRAMFEQARLLQFSAQAYCQLQIDCAFLKHMISHYIADGYHPGGTSASSSLASLLDDFMEVVCDRCQESGVTGANDILDCVRSFLSTDSGLKKSFIIDED